MKFTNIIAIFIITLFAIISAHAQDETIRVETNLVTINVAVTDKQGKFVKGLRQDQFEIFDNKTKQQIEHFSSADAPVSYGIVYDMHPTTDERTAAVLDSLRAFTKDLPEKDDFFVLVFGMNGALKTDFVPTAEQLAKQMDSREPNSLYDAIYVAADKLRASRNLKRTLLIISDSADHQSRHSFSDLSAQLKTLDVQVYAVIIDES
jgi:Ca-activated chloride channel homolog